MELYGHVRGNGGVWIRPVPGLARVDPCLKANSLLPVAMRGSAADSVGPLPRTMAGYLGALAENQKIGKVVKRLKWNGIEWLMKVGGGFGKCVPLKPRAGLRAVVGDVWTVFEVLCPVMFEGL